MITTAKVKPKAIIFFGPDGSGKTTQAELLVKELRNKGIKTRKLWLRSLHTLAFLVSVVAMKSLHLKDVYEFRTKYSSKQPLRTIWYGIEFVSILPLVFSKMKLPLVRGNTVVAERYVVDWIVQLSYVTHNEGLLDSSLARIVLGLIPKNSTLIFVDATFDAISARGRTEDSFDFIAFQRNAYTRLAKSLGANIIDTSDKNLQEVHESILGLVLNEHVRS